MNAPPEHPTPEMIEAGVRMHCTPRTGAEETLVHDIWQSMYDAWQNKKAIAASVSGAQAMEPSAEALDAAGIYIATQVYDGR